MGVHFDALVDLVEHSSIKDERTREYLANLLERAVLFDPQFGAEQLFDMKPEPDQDPYMRDFFLMGNKHGRCLLTPFETIAIEDHQSVVIFDPQNTPDLQTGIDYSVIVCSHNPGRGLTVFKYGVLRIDYGRELEIDGNIAQIGGVVNEELFEIRMDQIKAFRSIISDTFRFIYQAAYIMEASNLIVETQGPDDGMRTADRTTYACLNQEDARLFLCGELEYPVPTSTDWRRTGSPGFKIESFQRRFIDEHLARDLNGHRLLVKDAPDKVVKY